ncbi:MAG TPA: XRE family transcriptional regulator, partial [Campylobacterales bacterium]|nr:XRE family transcriptional regulator [Campylobacterales bacterium]
MQKGKNMFGELLKKYRKIADLTLEELAQRVNERAGTTYTKATVRSWEKGNNPKVVIIQIIADILDIPVQYLFDDSDKV